MIQPPSPNETRRVAVLGGTGHEGGALALRFAAAHWEVLIGSRDQARAQDKAAEIRQLAGAARVLGLSNPEAAAGASLVFLCVPFDHAAQLLTLCRAHWQAGTVVVDTTVPLVFDKALGALMQPLEANSASESLAPLLPPGVSLVAAFKTIPAHVLADLGRPLDCDVFVCGDDQAARGSAIEAAATLPGLRALDGGPLRHARALEAMCALVVGLNRRYRSKSGRFQVTGL